ncbi:C40 family peptidase [Aciduricibacillus chroicocephali]|uniref:C40 family peptidase n=1 Tax=Aciduricibacillus chroicocephali TaxID=3054939 RepID=A0ABY9KXE4_9BACI|nr:C40 family peptidase [Bacillaceae bacterium 44XB]
MKKKILLIASLLMLCFPVSSFAKSGTSIKQAYINVPVINVWKDPVLRQIDKPAAKKNADIEKWIKSMNYHSKLALVGKLDTQVLYGEGVLITSQKKGWSKISIPSQIVPGKKNGYTGWVPTEQLVFSKSFDKQQSKPFASITSKSALLYRDAALSKKAMNLSFNTRLPILEIKNGNAKVITPDGSAKWLKKGNFKAFKDSKEIPAPTGQNLVKTGRQFLNLPYLWAGLSGFGFDCSGFTYAMHRANGIDIPRDSTAQAKSGQALKKSQLKPGDLLFFAHNNGKGKVHHVAMYAGGGKMIHSPNTASSIRIDSINAPGYKNEYAGARRYYK